MNPKKARKDEGRMDLTDLKPDMDDDFNEIRENEELIEVKPRSKKQESKAFQVGDFYAHVYERVTNGGKVIKVLRQNAKVTEISRTPNWVEIETEDGVRGFVRPGQLVELKEEVDE